MVSTKRQSVSCAASQRRIDEMVWLIRLERASRSSNLLIATSTQAGLRRLKEQRAHHTADPGLPSDLRQRGERTIQGREGGI